MRVLVVGLGLVAQRHIANLKALDPGITVAVWRQRPDPPGWAPPAGVAVDRWFNPDTTWGHLEIENWQPEAAIIANPASMHVDAACWLGGHLGIPLFIEKPIADRLSPELDALLDTMDYGVGLPIMVGYDLRFYRPLQLVKAAIAAGRIGRPLSFRAEVGQYLPDWRPGRDYRTGVSALRFLGGGVLLELSHEIDYARWLMGEVAAVSAQVGRLSDLELDVEDTADLMLRFESGALGSIHLDMVDRAPVRRCRVVGMEGSVECDIEHAVAWLLPPGGQPECLAMIRWANGEPEPEPPFLAEMRHFLACCRGEASFPVDGADALATLRVVDAARRSAADGREVRV